MRFTRSFGWRGPCGGVNLFLAREPNHGVIKFWRPRENGDPWILVNSGSLGPAHDITVFHTQISAVPVPSMEKASASDQKIQAGEQHFGTAEIQFNLCDVCYTDDYAVLSVYQVGVGSY